MATIVTLEELQKNFCNYNKTTVIIADCPLFIKPYSTHEYEIKISTKHNSTVTLDTGAKVRLPLYNKNCFTKTGIAEYPYWYGRVVLPTTLHIGAALTRQQQYLRESLDKYTHLMEHKTKQIENLNNLLQKYPEHLL